MMSCNLCRKPRFEVANDEIGRALMKAHLEEKHKDVLAGHGLKGQWRGPDDLG